MPMNSPSSPHSHPERALAAIVLTDAVSFSARMSVDEEGTLKLINRDLQVISDLCDRYGGQVLKSLGDGLLMSFYSAVQAVLCAQEIQKEFAKMTEGLPTEDYLMHRIGIHLGDVLFSHDDVLGNGVNIAARLQTQALPGGICMSQTVYDVVKARVDLEVTYLGPLTLKNIQEPVPAYQIPPVGASMTLVAHQPPSLPASPPPSPLAIAAATLEQEPQIRRIKKLLFGTYQGVWENDPRVLMKFSLVSLLEMLHQRYPTLIALEKALQSTAARLNHKAEYLIVTHLIVAALEPVYYEMGDNLPSRETTQGSQVRDRYHAIAKELNQQAERLRIKKLLYAIIHSVWENNPATLGMYTLEDLVTEVHKIAPQEADLTYHLERIVKRLNHQSRYTQIAHLISEVFHPLYGSPNVAALPSSAEETSLETSEGNGTPLEAGDMPPSDEGPNSVTYLDSQSSQTVEQTIAQAAPTTAPAAYDPTEPKKRDRANLYNLRLEIMRYTNPLRAKILLLSTVRSPFTASPQDWITLKSKTLDDLIADTFAYCGSFPDLESKLTIMCHCVDGVPENLQTAGAILQAMKPFYP